MKKKISIVVPVYNVEEYIAKCLDSCVNQTFDDYNVYVLNDGSPYNEQVIIDEFAEKYKDRIIPIQKENGGYGSNLQLAFELSDADYVLVCDSDDYLDSKCLETLYNKMVSSDADIVIGAKNLVFSDNNEIKYDKSYNDEYGVLTDGTVYHRGDKDFNVLYFVEPSPHAKLYKRKIVKNIKFPFKTSYTDNLLYFYALEKANSVCYVETPFSYYLINREGNTRTDLKPKVIDDFNLVYNEILNQSDVKDNMFYYRMFEAFMSIFYKVECIKANNEEKRVKYESIYPLLKRLLNHNNEIKDIYLEYGKDSDVVKKTKLALLDEKKSLTVYKALVDNKINNNIVNKIKLRLSL